MPPAKTLTNGQIVHAINLSKEKVMMSKARKEPMAAGVWSRFPIRRAIPVWASVVFALAGAPGLSAQSPAAAERAVDEAGLTIVCETYCSETRLRTANARIHWYASQPKTEAASVDLGGQATLQTTVFDEGFEKGLFVTVSAGRESSDRRVVPAEAQARATRPLRAYQFRVLGVEIQRRSAVDTAESGILVEDLEPGVNYQWRVVVGAAGAASISPVVTCMAPICPADLVEPQPKPGVRP